MTVTAQKLLWGVLGTIVALALWQWLAATVSGPGSVLPSATESIGRAVELLAESNTWLAIGSTLFVALTGLVFATIAGLIIGALIATSKVFMHATRFVIEFLRPIPPIVILPVVVLILGPTAQMGIFLVFFGCTLIIAIQSAAGVEDTDPLMVDTARSYGMSRGEIMSRVVLPNAMPYLGTAMRITAPAALLITIVAGLLGGGPGLGFSLVQARMSSDTVSLFGYVIILGLLGAIVQGLSEWSEKKLFHWHPQYRTEPA